MFQRSLQIFTRLYPVWLVLCASLALWRPATFVWFTGPLIPWSLMIVMLGMGLTLTVEYFRRLFRMPGALALGFLAHYSIMPLAGWALGRMLNLDSGLAVGLILVASCPSGTASNVISFLARADVALAVAVTLTSTLLAFVMTPIWCQALAGHYVPVDAWGISLSTLQVVVAPVLIGASATGDSPAPWPTRSGMDRSCLSCRWSCSREGLSRRMRPRCSPMPAASPSRRSSSTCSGLDSATWSRACCDIRR